jgi:hypothetical protein
VLRRQPRTPTPDALDDDRKALRGRLDNVRAVLDEERLQERFAGVGLTTVADAPERRPVRVGGEVRMNTTSATSDQPWLVVQIADGTGKAVARFTGRRRLRGLEVGRAVLLEGVGRREHGQLILLNPAYTLLP